MIEFIKKMTDWILEKEDKLAKSCAIDPQIVEEQIQKIADKKEELHRKCKENEEELERVLDRLKRLKIEAERCRVDDKNSIVEY